MLSSISFSALSVLAALGPVSAAVVARQASTCSSLHLMVAGGCQLPCQSDELSLLTTTVSNITSAIPNTDVYLVPYDGATFQAQESTVIMEEAANAYAAECPNTPIVFIGYSLGGIIVTNTLCGGIAYNPNVIGSITYGEETQVYPAPYDAGTCTNNAPTYPRLNAATACAAYAPVMKSFCDASDPACCAGGLIIAAHYQYANLYDVEARDFIVSQYDNFVKTAPAVPSPTSSSVSAPASSSAGSSASTSGAAVVKSSSTGAAVTSAAVVPATYPTVVVYSNSSSTYTTIYTTKAPAVVPAGGASGSVAGPASSTVVTRKSTIVVSILSTTTISLYTPPVAIPTPKTLTGNSATFIPLTAVAFPTSIPATAAATGKGSSGTATGNGGSSGNGSSGGSNGNGSGNGSSGNGSGNGSGSNASGKGSSATATNGNGNGAATATGKGGVASGTGAGKAGSTLTPYNPNGAASLAMPGFLFACGLVAAMAYAV